MSGILICLSAAVWGVDYGWQPVAGGGIEYIIQIEPELLDSLKAGHDLFSDLPPTAENVRSYRITVGTGRLPHQGEPLPSAAAGTPDAQRRSTSDEAALVAVRHPADIDLSQLPGPVLGPALVRPSSANAADEIAEPPHLTASEATPLANRVAGYHAKAESAPVNDKAGADDDEDTGDSHTQLATKYKDGKEKPPHEANLQKATQDGRQAAADGGPSPSDPDREPSQAQTGIATLLQLGLFASLCSNVFLVWVATGQRSRYRALVRRMFDRSEQGTIAPPLITSAPDTPQREPSPSPPTGDAQSTKSSGD